MLRKYQIAEGKIAAAEQEVSAGIWVYTNPDETERRYLVDALKVDEHTLNSALDPDEISRVEFEPDHVAIIFKRPKNYSAADNFLFKVLSQGFFLYKEKLVVVMSEDVPLFDTRHFLKVNSPAEVMLRLLNRTILHFLEHLRVITMVSDSLEQKVNSSMENKYLLNLFTLEKSLVYYLNAIHSNSVTLDRMKTAAAAKIGLSAEQIELLDDVAIENQQCYRQAEIYSNILSSLVSARVSVVNNNLSALMKTLNIVTIGIMVPTFVVSAFSMNVAIPLQKNPHAFWMIMVFAICSVLGFMAFWRYKRW